MVRTPTVRWLALPLVLAGCSPVARLELAFLHGGAPLDPALFHLTGSKACPPAPVAPPAPAAPRVSPLPSTDPAELHELALVPGGLRVVAAFRGVRCRVRVTGFYDSNRDGAVGPGDLVATSPEIEVSDRGLFRGNLTVGPALRLSALP